MRTETVPHIARPGEDLAGDGCDAAALGGVLAAGPVGDAVRLEEVLGRRRRGRRGGVARGGRGRPAEVAAEIVLLSQSCTLVAGQRHH